MSISMNNFEAAVEKDVLSAKAGEAVAEARQAVGYSLEQLAVTTGLTVDELTAIESGVAADPAQLQRVASGLGLPAAAFLAV